MDTTREEMEEINKGQQLLASLEDLLVREFRAYQSLVGMIREERRALVDGDVGQLQQTIESKDALLDEIARLESSRSQMAQAWSQMVGFEIPSPSIAEMIPALESAVSDRYDRLREGILALIREVQEITRGNSAVALCELERLEAVRLFLLDQARPRPGYEPPGSGPAPRSAASWEVEQWA